MGDYCDRNGSTDQNRCGFQRGRQMTIAIHLEAGNFSYVTASDTQVTYEGMGAKVDIGKIRGAFRANPSGAINVAGAGWASYITGVSQEIVDMFQGFRGTPDQLEKRMRTLVREFYKNQILPFVGQLDDANVPDYSLLIAARHKRVTKLWNVDGMLFTKSDSPFDCIGIGDSVATALLNRLYPRHPTLDSIAILAAYVIYRVKSSVDGCGLKTEIRFIHQDKIGIVPFDRIEKWEVLFRKYERMEREIFYHAMNFILAPKLPSFVPKEHAAAFPPQMKPLPEIVKDIEAMQEEFSKVTIF
jgi:hypothetical protein